MPNANLFPQAIAGGPTMQEHSTTEFPLLQTVVKIDSAALVADTATMAGGATLEFEATGGNARNYRLSVPALGFSDAGAAAAGGWYCYSTVCTTAGGLSVYVDVAGASANLSWTRYGSWDVFDHPKTATHAAFVTGYKTPNDSVPTSGSATYNGSTFGKVYVPQAGASQGIGAYHLFGNASLQANFGSGSITGSLTNMQANGQPWNSVSLLGAISGGVNYFSGTSAATSAPHNPGSLHGSATGTFAGMFFGPSAQELGAVWTLHDGTSTAIGSIGAKTGP